MATLPWLAALRRRHARAENPGSICQLPTGWLSPAGNFDHLVRDVTGKIGEGEVGFDFNLKEKEQIDNIY
jgi:vacuolar-type H+-ATPase subunit B/Vma2